MEKKSILIVILILIILLIICVGFVDYNPFFKETFDVGDVTFDVPEGFHIEDNPGSSDIRISNGVAPIFIGVLNDSDVKYHVSSYIVAKKDQNVSVNSTNYTVDDIIVYKVVANDTKANHIWFEFNNKTYYINTWGYHDKIDTTAFKLIDSIRLVDK